MLQLQPMVHGQKSCRGQGCAELGERSKSAVRAVRAVLPQKLQQLHAASEEERKRLETYYKDRITQYDEKLREVSGGCAGCWENGTTHVRGLRIQGGEGDASVGAGSVSWQWGVEMHGLRHAASSCVRAAEEGLKLQV